MPDLELVATNLKAVSRDLREAGTALQRREFSKELKAAAEPVVAKARQEAPERTGRLRRSIKPYASGAGTRPYVRFGSRLVYANAINFGGRVGINKSVHIKPNNFMQRAVDAKRDEAAARVQSAVQHTVRRYGF